MQAQIGLFKKLQVVYNNFSGLSFIDFINWLNVKDDSELTVKLDILLKEFYK